MKIACDTDAHDWVLSPSMVKLEEQIEQIEWKREEKGDTSTLQFLILFHIILSNSFIINKNNKCTLTSFNRDSCSLSLYPTPYLNHSKTEVLVTQNTF